MAKPKKRAKTKQPAKKKRRPSNEETASARLEKQDPSEFSGESSDWRDVETTDGDMSEMRHDD